MQIFHVEAKKLIGYDANEGIELIRQLLWAEAWRVGIPRHSINISSDITVADGGIDAAVDTTEAHGSILIPGHTNYQVKTGASFKPWQRAEIKTELFGKQLVGLAGLGAQTRRGLEQGGTYSLVALGHDLTSEQRDQTKELLAENFAACGFPNTPIQVLGAGEIAGILALHPSLCLEINGLGNVKFQTIGSWRAGSDMTPSLSLGVLQAKFIEDLRERLEVPEVQHVRIIGEPGIGKTRLALEALSGRENLSASAMYFRQASDFQGSIFFHALMREGEARSVIIVVDECEDSERADIWRALKGRPGVKIVTIDHGPDTAGGTGMQTMQAPLLEQEQIESILRGYLPGNQLLRNWAMWCDGSARVAHALGENLRDHPEDILRSPDTVQIWERFISGYGSEVEGGRARTVLMHIALFEMFGYLHPVKEEADFVCELVRKVDPSITRTKFDQIVCYYQQRRILQGDRTLRVVPKALRIHLWREWWRTFGASADIRELLDSMPKSLHRWFMYSFIYARDVGHALSVVRALLDPDSGLFSDNEVIASEVGAGFIAVLAEAAPAETLTLLRRILRWTDEDLKALRSERQTLGHALAIIAVWQPHFRIATRVLARLCQGETSAYSNNCRGTLKSLFSPFSAPTQAPFSERADLALEMLGNTSDFVRGLGLDLCAACLNTRGDTRLINVEFQGAQPEIVFWRAALWSDLTSSWTSVISSLIHARACDDKRWSVKVDHVLIEGVGALLKANVLHDVCLDTLSELVQERRNFHEIYQLLTNLGKHPPKNLPAEINARLAQLRTEMDGADFHSLLLRHVLAVVWDDDIEESKEGGVEKRASRIRSLAMEAVADMALLRAALPELFLSEVWRQAIQFGEELAAALVDDRFDQEILDHTAQHLATSRSPFLAGYLRGAFKLSPTRWESLCLALLAMPSQWIPVSVVESGASPAVFERLLEVLNNSGDSSYWIAAICREPIAALYGRERIRTAIEAVLRKGEAMYRCAMQMAEWSLCKTDDELDLPLAMSVLAAGVNLHADVMTNHYWGVLAERFLTAAPQFRHEIFRSLVEGVASFGGLASNTSMSKTAIAICRSEPHSTWRIVAEALQSERPHFLRTWLADDDHYGETHAPAISAFNESDIFAWIDEDKIERSHHIVGLLPKTLEVDAGGNLTKAFLTRYYDVDGIGASLIFHFGMGLRSGLRSEYLSARRSSAQRWMANERNSSVGDWLEEYAQSLSKEIEMAKIQEERSLWG